MRTSMRQISRRITVWSLALLLVLSGILQWYNKPVAAQAAYHQAYIQTTVDTAIWEILAGVVDTEAAPFEEAMEYQRIKGEMLEALAGTETPSDAAGYISSPLSGTGHADENLVLVFPGDAKSESTIVRTSSDAQDTARASLVRNSLIYDLNLAFKFVYGDDSGNYLPNGSTVDDRFDQYKADMETFLSQVPNGSANGATLQVGSSSTPALQNITFPDATIQPNDYVVITKGGQTQVFLYRMPKGYVWFDDSGSTRNMKDLGLTKVSSSKDTRFVHWGQLAVEAFLNYACDEKVQVTVDNVYNSTPTAFESVFANLLGNFCNWIAGALGLWSFDELIFNAGLRGGSAYVGGIFPSSWQSFIWAFFFVMEVAAVLVLLYAVLFTVAKKAMSTVNPLARASAMEQIEYLLGVTIVLGLLPFALHWLIGLSANCTGIFQYVLDGKTASERFKTLAANSGSIGSVLTYLIYLGALIYFNIFYIVRGLSLALLIVFAPVFVSMAGVSASKQQLALTWFKEFLANLFIQPLQAIMLCFILMLPSSGRNFESIVLAYVMIPLTSMLRSLFFGNSGGLLAQIAERGKKSALVPALLAAGVAGGAVHGAAEIGMAVAFNGSPRGQKKESASSSQTSQSSQSSPSNSSTQAPYNPPAPPPPPSGSSGPSIEEKKEDTTVRPKRPSILAKKVQESTAGRKYQFQ